MSKPTYSRAEVDAILGRALERTQPVNGMSHQELLDAAAEIGLPPAAIERAVTEVLAERREQTEVSIVRRQAWRGFLGHLIPYLFINGFFLLLNRFTPNFYWSLVPILGWGMGLLFHFLAVAFPSQERLERRLERYRRRQQRRETRARLRAGAKGFEQAVGEGVAALLEVAADRINQKARHANTPPPPQMRVGEWPREGEAPRSADGGWVAAEVDEKGQQRGRGGEWR